MQRDTAHALAEPPEVKPAPAQPVESAANVLRNPPFGRRAPDHSLFGEILDWMLVPILAVWPVALTLTYLFAQGLSNEPYDLAMEDAMREVAAGVVLNDKRDVLTLSKPSLVLLQSPEAAMREYQLLGLRGELIAGSLTLPVPFELDRKRLDTVTWRDELMDNKQMRVAAMWFIPRDAKGFPGTTGPALIQLAEDPKRRDALASSIVRSSVLPLLGTLPLFVILMYLGLHRGTRPLQQLQRSIVAREPHDLSPVDEERAPAELKPFLKAINGLLAKQQSSLSAQKRFIADAAHQMKTPLAGLRMQAELAQRQTDPAELRKSLAQLARSTKQATHVVNQLLALARTEHGREQGTRRFARLDLKRLAAQVMQDLAPIAFDRHIELAFEAEEPIWIDGDAIMLAELIKNLLDNALHYTPLEGAVSLAVHYDSAYGSPTLQIDDSGPGVAPEHRELIFEPFYRTLGTGVDGSGLGLSIVKEIVMQHHAVLRVEYNPKLMSGKTPGSRFSVVFQRSASSQSTTSANPAPRSAEVT